VVQNIVAEASLANIRESLVAVAVAVAVEIREWDACPDAVASSSADTLEIAVAVEKIDVHLGAQTVKRRGIP